MLRDLRAKVDEQTDQVMTAIAMARGVEKAELVREVLGEWATARLHEANLIVRLTRSEGEQGKGRA